MTVTFERNYIVIKQRAGQLNALKKHARKETQLGLYKFRDVQIPDATSPGRLNRLKCA